MAKKRAKSAKKRTTAKKRAPAKKRSSKAVMAKVCCPECGCCQSMKKNSNRKVGAFECKGCGDKVPAKDCCIFCDYSNKPCPCCADKKKKKK